MGSLRKLICTLAAVASTAVCAATAGAETPPDIRVLVIDKEGAVTIAGEGSGLMATLAPRSVQERFGAALRIAAGPSGLLVAGRERGPELTLTCSARRYRVGNRSFRGTITVLWKAPRELMVVNALPLEDYLAGLINSEISSSWPPEAIKAQSVAARTYALHQIETAKRAASRPYDITGTVLDQVYDGAHQEDQLAIRAVGATRGQVLLRAGALFPSYYHSCCGGQTEHAHNVWPGEAGPPPIRDPYCAGSLRSTWSAAIPLRAFISGLARKGVALSNVRSIATAAHADSPRTDLVLIDDDRGIQMVQATELRRLFGYGVVKSTWFNAEIQGSQILFTGRGYGHGVGLCQWGAKGMAEEGFGYRDILKFYYPDAEVAAAY